MTARRALVALALVAALGVAAFVVVRFVLHSPERAVHGYFTALTDRDAEAAKRFLESPQHGISAPALPFTSLLQPYEPPADVRVTKTTTVDDRRHVTVAYLAGGEPHTTTLVLGWRDGRAWRIEGGVARLVVRVPAATPAATVNGQRVETLGESTSLNAFPGVHQVGLTANPVLEAAPVRVVIGLPEGASVRLTASVRQDIAEEVRAQVKAFIDTCATSADAAPAGCPLRVSARPPVRWSVTGYPAIDLRLDNGRLLIDTARAGEATATYDGTRTSRSPIEVSGFAVVEGGKVTVTVAGGEDTDQD